ncbi:KAP family NTPase [Algibacter sp.]|nr:P-loop NTPase fold protein [Algibacter sp.]MDA9069187.1 KAP family NTPase [Algibacter sp.]MDC1365027.1 KAP family NTPase [Algibacter sp.]
MKHTISSDKPIINEQQDRFQRYNFSKRIAESIINNESESGNVIGVYGAWGEGKTSILNMIITNLESDENTIIINFNPWRYRNEDELILNYLVKISSELNIELNTKSEKVGKFIEQISSITSLIGADASKLGKLLANVDLEELKKRVETSLAESKKKLVIIIDDIDRLNRDELFSMFRLVKLTADFNSSTYILSFDEKMVASALGGRFGAGDEEAGRNFLEKIIQVPLTIPKASELALKNYCLELIENVLQTNSINILESEVNRFKHQFTNNILVKIETPRMAIRYSNALAYSIPLLKGEVNIVDLMLIESLKMFFPGHYQLIRNNLNLLAINAGKVRFQKLAGIKKEEDYFEREIKKLQESIDEKLSKAGRNITNNLFPNREVSVIPNFSLHDSTEQVSRTQAIYLPEYSQRYFSYAVLEGEISDTELGAFLNNLKKNKVEDVISDLRLLIEKSSFPTVLGKFNTEILQLNWEESQNFIFTLAKLEEFFPRNPNEIPMIGFGIQKQTAQLIFNIIKNCTDKGAQYEFSLKLMDVPFSYDFTYEINNILRSGEASEKLFTDKQYGQIAEALRKRAIVESGNDSFYKKFETGVGYLFHTWFYANKKDMRKYVDNFLEKDSTEVMCLIISMTPTAYTMGIDKVSKASFTKEYYDVLDGLFDADYLYGHIIKGYKSIINAEAAKFDHFELEQTDINILRQFVHWHKLKLSATEN